MSEFDRQRILPRFYARQEAAERQRQIARIVLETGSSVVAVSVAATVAGDSRQLRGIPAVARGVSGTQPGTDPLRRLMAQSSD